VSIGHAGPRHPAGDPFSLDSIRAARAEHEELERERLARARKRGRQLWARWLAEGTFSYRSFLASPVWARTRRTALYRAAHRCQAVDSSGHRCEARSGLEVHHLTYARVGDEDWDDLVVLCRAHHAATHGRDR
jgi:hypothetical protein